MGRKLLLISLILASLRVPVSFCQKTQSGQPESAQEFPAVFRQAVAAGKTVAGTKVQAKLVMATLVNGTVIPKGAILTGEVTDSVAKSRTDTCRLGIRIDSATWKNGSAPLKLYLTSWFHPSFAESGQNLQYGPEQPASRTWNGTGEYPNPNTRSYKPFPEDTSDKNQTVPDTPNSVMGKQLARMKDVDIESGNSDSLVLVNKHSNIKLDRFTTYVFAPSDVLPKN